MNAEPVSPCPDLPPVDRRWTAADLRDRRGVRDAEFFEAVLRYGQSLWLDGKPAQALLQLNRALSVPPVVMNDAERLPYPAKLWIFRNAGGGFLGNPVRHYQHLATRVNEPFREMRSWRAWACFHLASRVLDPAGFPRDEAQIVAEGLRIPEWEEVLRRLEALGVHGETGRLEALMREAAATGG